MKSKYLFLFCTCCLVLLSACCKDNPDSPKKPSRTILIYLAADNSLSGFVQEDLVEMKEGVKSVDETNARLLVYVDDGSLPRLVELKKRNGKVEEQLVKSYGQRNSVGVAETKEVFHDVFSNPEYQAESYGLVYWSHGDGWIPHTLPTSRWVGQDTGNGTYYMNISDLVSILNDAPHFDFILFDACFMQSIEVAYALRDFTDYYIGSPTEIPGPGASYDVLVPSMLTAKKGNVLAIADAYYKPYAAVYEGKYDGTNPWKAGVSICVLKSAELQKLADVTKDVLLQNVVTLQELRSSVFDYDKRASINQHVGYYDMVQMMRLLSDNAGFAAWKQAYDAACIDWQTTRLNCSGSAGMFSMEGSSGVSHYIPGPYTAAANAAYRSTSWYEAAGLSLLGW
ncbi:clostripain-related cysteine peptidase [Bacteroides zoogleoformans]|uniref:clostripain-related cysteine peptidase n=1 Tax=Bacteroides zoogleoformans TaxID=28119 RepID=UPI00248EE14A|nr:clostripain-related cysteine peptidase [Bacteroides zoogleoformans]